ncbi:sensor histidine kinase [Arthrobacter sp. Hz1]
MTDAKEWPPERRRPPRRPPFWVGDLGAALLIIAAAFAPFPGSEFRPGSGLATVLVIAPALVLPLRRWWPVPVLVAVVALYGAACLAGTLSPGIVVAAAIAIFGVASTTTRPITLIVAFATLPAVVLFSQFASVGNIGEPPVLQFAFMIAFASAAGDASRSRQEYITAMTERAERAEQTRDAEASRRVAEERLRIARDLHDAVAHQISVISLNAGVASSALETRPERAREALGTIRSASRTVLSEIGNLLEVLRTDDRNEDANIPQPGLDRLDDLLAQFSTVGLVSTTRVDGQLSRVGSATGLVAYRVIQEGLTNAHKHGSEHRAHVLIVVTKADVTIIVTNPVHPDVAPLHDDQSPPGGHGLLGISERVAAVRGTVQAGSTPDGWRVLATLPLTTEEPS